MKKITWIIGGVAVLLILSSATLVSAKSVEPKMVKKQAQKVGNPLAARKVPARPIVEVAPRITPKKVAPSTRFRYIKVQAPVLWYYNVWVLFMGGSLLLLVGTLFGRLLKLGPIPRRLEESSEGVEIAEPSRLKRFFLKFRKPATSCQPA